MSDSQDMETDQENGWDEVLEEEKESSVNTFGFDAAYEYDPKKKVLSFTIYLFINYTNLLIQEAFIVYDRENIEKRLNEKISELTELLGLSKDDAIATLRHFKWDMDKIQNSWFEGGK